MEFSDILRNLRIEKGLTQLQVADAIKTTKNAIWTYENEYAEPSIATIISLANFFGVSIDYLLDREGEDSIITITGNELSDDENHLIDTVRMLNAKNKEVVYQYVEFLIEQQRKGVL